LGGMRLTARFGPGDHLGPAVANGPPQFVETRTGPTHTPFLDRAHRLTKQIGDLAFIEEFGRGRAGRVSIEHRSSPFERSMAMIYAPLADGR
jgi:hypothetical protein